MFNAITFICYRFVGKPEEVICNQLMSAIKMLFTMKNKIFTKISEQIQKNNFGWTLISEEQGPMRFGFKESEILLKQ